MRFFREQVISISNSRLHRGIDEHLEVYFLN